MLMIVLSSVLNSPSMQNYEKLPIKAIKIWKIEEKFVF